MNLIQIRTQFRQLSGRYDLVNTDFSDNGADFFINEGVRFLDRLDETQKSWANNYQLMAIGDYLVSFPYCRAIKEIWASTTEARWQLEKKSLQDIIDGYGTGLPSSLTSGVPLYYSPCITRYIPEDMDDATLATFASYIEIPTKIPGAYNAAVINVPTDTALTLIISGLFHSMELSDDTDSNYWTEVHPMLLYMTTMRYVELANRNIRESEEWTKSIRSEVEQLGMDLVEENIAEVSEID